MGQGFPVLVTRFKRSYLLINDRNDNFMEAIKAQDNVKFNGTSPKGWIISALSLFRLMLHFRKLAEDSGSFRKYEIDWIWENEELKSKFTDLCLSKLIPDEKLREENQAAMVAQNAKMVRYKEKLNTVTEFKFDFSPYIKDITPFPHQKRSALWLWQAKSGILAAQMGLGKTLIYTLACEIDPTVKKVLIICPNSLKLTLRDEEIHRYFHSKAYILGAKKNPYPVDECKYFITNYEYFARKDFDPIKKLKAFGIDQPDLVIIDESHRIKEMGSNTFQNINDSFADNKGIRFIMSTGTPIKSASRELFSQLHLVNPFAFPSKDNFYRDYCGMFWDKNIKMWVYDSRKERAGELNSLIQPYMYRILKEDALDLPEKIFTRILIELTPEEQKNYNEIEEGVANEIFNEEKMGAALPITIMLRLQQYCAQVKVKHLEEMIQRMLNEGDKVVFIDRFKETLREINKIFPTESAIHSGDQSTDDRQLIKKQFSDPESDLTLFLGSAATCNAGLTLTVSSKLFLNTLEYTVADCEQLYDRIHRIGQTHACNYYLPIIKGTIDERIYMALEAKKRVFAKVIDNQDHKDTSSVSVLKDVLQDLKTKYNKK